MDSAQGALPCRRAGCPIRRSSDQCLVASSPMLIAAAHVLRRHSTPRHPPHAASSFFFVPPSREAGSHEPGRGVLHTPGGHALLASAILIDHQSSDRLGGDRCISRSGFLWRPPSSQLSALLGTRRVLSSVGKVQNPPLDTRDGLAARPHLAQPLSILNPWPPGNPAGYALPWWR